MTDEAHKKATDKAWERWFNVHFDLWEDLEARIDKAVSSPEFGAALVAALIEHLAEKLRFCITLPETSEETSAAKDPELGIACPSCSAPAGQDCHGFGYCPARSANLPTQLASSAEDGN